MKTKNTLQAQSFAPQNSWQQDLREEYFAHCLPSAARYQFRTATSTIEHRALTQPESTLYEFEACMKALEQLHLIGRLLREEGHHVMMSDGPLDERWSRKLKHKLFENLRPETQQLLKQQGLKL